MNTIAKERLYLTKDKDALVHEGDKRGHTLYAAPGDEIPDSAAAQFGLVGGRLKPATAKASVPKTASTPRKAAKGGGKGEDKEAAKGEDKEQAGEGDKADQE